MCCGVPHSLFALDRKASNLSDMQDRPPKPIDELLAKPEHPDEPGTNNNQRAEGFQNVKSGSHKFAFWGDLERVRRATVA